MEAAPGFEPGIKDLQSSALPLGYAATIEKSLERKTGFEPATPTLARLCSTPELLPRNLTEMVAGPRIELGTRGFSVRCSTY